jgi:hypothetical protein
MPEPSLPLVLLLHDGGWDEVLWVALGLLAAYLIIVWTGRKGRDEDQLEEADPTDGDGSGLAPGPTPDQTPSQRS